MPERDLKTYDQALSEAARTWWALTGREPDLVDGSRLLSLFEAVSFQASDLSYRFQIALEAAVPEAIFSSFDFARKPAQPARGSLRFSSGLPAPAPLLIPAGLICATADGQEFVTVADAYLAFGESVLEVGAVASVPGILGNVASSTVTILTSGVSGISAVLNPTAFSGGQDAENLLEQRGRFTRFLDRLDRSSLTGVQVAVLEARTALQEAVDDALIVDGNLDVAVLPGTFRTYVYKRGGVGTDLEVAVTGALEFARAGGCIPALIKVTGTPVNVTASLLTSVQGSNLRAALGVDAYFRSLRFGQKASFENLIAVLKASSGAVIEPTLSSPSADVACSPYQHLELGSISITETVVRP